ncbi:hypothetical protein P8452_49168 [Trifolium repens]|nr:hypothetical protein P8452_49168 [Trifolium repens]
MVVNQMHRLLNLQMIHKEGKQISVLFERLASTIGLEELRDATESFTVDNAIGAGKMGMMYLGFLPNGQSLAVKRLFDSKLYTRQFLLETMIIGRYKHKNIVPLLGFCIEGKERLLAYPYMSNGRLSKWLHPFESEVIRLKWHQRVNIALGIARGLSWLHHTYNLGATFKVNDGKKDVYAFGSVLFELITGKSYTELSHSYDLCNNPLRFYNVIDKSVIEEGLENEVCTLIKIACECVHPLLDQRPTMLEVYNNMNNVSIGGRKWL